MSEYGLVADIGGTNIRLALVNADNTDVTHIQNYMCADFSGAYEAISHYLRETDIQVKAICLAVACPTENDLITMTNNHWEFRKSELKSQLELDDLFVINDYPAIALSIPDLNDEQAVKIGGGEKLAGKPIAVFGPGTGLGVAHLYHSGDRWMAIPGEGGHVDFAPIDEDDSELLSFLQTLYPAHVSYEQVLSGLGLVQTYQAVCARKGVEPEALEPKDVTLRGLDASCEYCQAALEQFCRIMGSFAGNLALTAGAFGGVYIAGGIVPRFAEYFATSGFRERFEAKGRLSQYVGQAPTYVITESQPGLIGARAYLYSNLGRNV